MGLINKKIIKIISLFFLSLSLITIGGSWASNYYNLGQFYQANLDLSAQANPVIPQLPNFDKVIQKTIYVSNQNPKSSDNNNGSQNLPLKTINKAAEIAQENKQNNIGTKIIIYPGVYRETISIDKEGLKNNAPIIFAAAQPGKVIISGSDVWIDWRKDNNNNNIYVHKWPYKWGLAGNPWTQWKVVLEPIVQRREMVFIGGKLLKPVISFPELQPGTFYIAEPENKIYIYPYANTNLKKSQIEISVRNTLFAAENIKNIELRGLKFIHGNSALEATVKISNSENILVENSQFNWNSWSGLDISNSQNVVVKNSTANNNGERGMGGSYLKNVLYENTENSYNNWRGHLGKFYGWDAGQKFMFLHGGTFRNFKAVGNMSVGLWFDTDIRDILVEKAYICNNASYSIYIEAVQGPLTLKNSVICNNYTIAPETLADWYNPGIFTASARNITVEGNTICGNDRAQIRVMTQYDRDVEDFETKQIEKIRMENWTLKNNIIIGNQAYQMLMETPKWPHFLQTLDLDNNIWYNYKTTQGFKIDDKKLNFQEWQNLIAKKKDAFIIPKTSLPKACKM